MPPFPPLKAFQDVDLKADAQLQLDTSRQIFLTMLMRGPLSQKLSLVWMILIAAVGPLIRAEMARTEAYKKNKTKKTLAQLGLARLIMYLLVPLVVLASMIAFASMVFAVVCMFTQMELIGIWATLVLVLLIRVPVDAFFEYVGCGDAPVKYNNFKHRGTKLLIWASEGPVFKYYFTASLQVATVILQFNVLAISFSAFEFQSGTERYEQFLAPFGGLTGRLYADFFMLTTYDPAVSFSAFDMAISWRLPPIGMPNIPWDVILAQVSQLTYMIGVAVLVLEKVIAVVMMVIGVTPLEPGRESGIESVHV